MKKKLISLSAVLFFLPFFSFGSFIKLETGESIQGKILELKTEGMVFESLYGQVLIPPKKITQMDFTGETLFYEITLTDKSQVKGNPISMEDGNFTLNTEAGIIVIPWANIEMMMEKDYEVKKNEDRAKEEEKRLEEESLRIKNKVNQIILLGGYAVLTGDFKGKYKNAPIFNLILDRPVFTEGFLKNLRFGFLFNYQHLKASDVSNVSMDFFSTMLSVRFGFELGENGFLSSFYPYIRLSGGLTLVKLMKQSGISEGGIDKSYSAGIGIDYSLTQTLNIVLESDFFNIIEANAAFRQITVNAGLGLKF